MPTDASERYCGAVLGFWLIVKSALQSADGVVLRERGQELLHNGFVPRG